MSHLFKSWLTCALYFVAFEVCAASLVGKVVGVADGDTITVLDAAERQHKIRLSGIDAPEKKQPFGRRSKESLSDLVFSRTVVVETGKTDRYGRFLGKVLVDGKDVNLEQLRRGLAWHYKKYAFEQPEVERLSYSYTEQEARRAGLGIWRDPTPTPPWQFRQDSKAAK